MEQRGDRLPQRPPIVQLPSFTTHSGLVLGFIAGAAGGAVAIGVMELLAERTTFRCCSFRLRPRSSL